MKVLFFISVMGHGRGGHFHSLNHISNALSVDNEVSIYTIGPGQSSVMRSNTNFRKHFEFNGLSLFSIKRAVRVIKVNKFDIIHCFDANSYNVIRLFFSTKKYPIFLNKCGGPNTRVYPFAPNLILFSNENRIWFSSQKKYQDANISLIPNRVTEVRIWGQDEQVVKKEENSFSFVRICRIGSTYKKSISDAINLISTLLADGIRDLQLYIIGTIEDKDIYNKFQQNPLVKAGKIVFLTDEHSTKEASKMLYLADAVIGTGRGLMEASSLGIPLLTINKDGKIPVLLDNESFKYAFSTNFSERNTFPRNIISNNIRNIKELILDREKYNKVKYLSLQMFNKYFDINRARLKYTKAYNEAKYSKRNCISDAESIFRTLRKFYLNSRKK